MSMEKTDLDLDALEAAARTASPGPWEAEQYDETIELNKGTAITTWNESRTVGSPARSWNTIDRLISFDIEDVEEEEAEQFANDVEYIAAARPEVMLALIERLRAAETELLELGERES